MRWSLKTIFILSAVIAIAFGWKYNHRNRCLVAAKNIDEAGGSVFYAWENPKIVTEIRSFVPQPRKPTVGHRRLASQYPVSYFRRTGNSKPEFKWASVFGNSDVSIEAATIPESKVTEKLIASIAPLNFKYIMIVRDERYAQTSYTYYSSEVDHQEKLVKLAELGKPYDTAKLLLSRKLPNVELIDSAAINTTQ